MGLANQMMEVLTRIAFGLGDTDRDACAPRPLRLQRAGAD